MKKKKQPQKKSNHQKRSAGKNAVVIEHFTQQDIERWLTHGINAQSCFDKLYFELETQRVRNHDALCSSLQSVAPISVVIDNWVRIIDFQWSLEPLSSTGSLKGIGGRFNIGRELTRARGLQFPALYLAKDFGTAMNERYGGQLSEPHGRLDLQDFALRKPTSFLTIVVEGLINGVFDLRVESNLLSFVKIVSTFSISKETTRYFQNFRIQPQALARSTKQLMRFLLAEPANWRQMPQVFAIPAAGQIFGKFLRDAGFEAVIYPSQQAGTECLALFPENFQASNSYVKVKGNSPDRATITVLDKNHLSLPL